MEQEFDVEKTIKHWIKSSDNDFDAMVDLFETGHFNWAMFMGHLVLEKLLKALYSKQKHQFPPLIHDLRRICEKGDIELDLALKIKLDTITRFNINARYDDYKQSFYLLCTESFSA